jgi:hypothetical protein
MRAGGCSSASKGFFRLEDGSQSALNFPSAGTGLHPGLSVLKGCRFVAGYKR